MDLLPCRVSCTARRCTHMTEHRNVGARAGRGLSLIVCGSCLGIVGLTMSCAPPAPASPTAPPAGATVQAAGTQISAAAGAVATLQTAATQVASSAGTSVALSPLHVTNVTVDANDTTVTIQNGGSGSMNLGGWTLLMGPDFAMVLSDIAISGGQTRMLHFSQGTDT